MGRTFDSYLAWHDSDYYRLKEMTFREYFREWMKGRTMDECAEILDTSYFNIVNWSSPSRKTEPSRMAKNEIMRRMGQSKEKTK